MMLQISGDSPIAARRPDYRTDPVFAGQFDQNPFHDPSRKPNDSAQRKKALHPAQVRRGGGAHPGQVRGRGAR
jgi:hypothetical protein